MIAIGSDHAGFGLKEEIRDYLDELGIEYTDCGAYGTDSCDYPVYGEKVARAVASGEAERGIVVCGTGLGISITANKVKGIRCALCGDSFSAEMSRLHNDANVLALGARVTGSGLAKKIVEVFLNTGFAGAQHTHRLELIAALEARERNG